MKVEARPHQVKKVLVAAGRKCLSRISTVNEKENVHLLII
jgi:hypothetical protein